ncbi:RNA polymerase sigma-70 factor [Reichenbachiella versicolor]|uniref:RNA polymerase sigma-70 factor n=1 Tax=Reichenbachiella versicolor TaxID=1821036 RepID=UPI000D6E3C1A|nr:RNA polymerase sigma-70 factor [Reichenbachiella versicolor]
MSFTTQRDLGAFEKIFKEYYSSLLVYGIRMVGDRSEAEDVVQEVFFSYWNQKDKVEISHSVKSYLFGAVKRKCQNRLRHQMVVSKHQSELVKSPAVLSLNPEEILNNEELSKRINHCIDELPEKGRQVFRMNRYEGKKYKEIAEELNISIKTVEGHMTNALKKLRMALAEYAFLLFLIMVNYG